MILDQGRVGRKVRIRVPTLGLEKGTLGFIVEELPSSSGTRRRDIIVIFENGVLETFSAEETKRFISQAPDVHLKYCEYEYESDAQVMRDFNKGYWRFRRVDHERKRGISQKRAVQNGTEPYQGRRVGNETFRRIVYKGDK